MVGDLVIVGENNLQGEDCSSFAVDIAISD